MTTRETLIAIRRAIALAAVLFLAVAVPAKAELHVSIDKGTVEPLPIAVTQFYGEPVGQQIANVVEADLERSGLFRPLDHRAFIQTPDQLAAGLPRYGDWKVINAQALVSGTAAVQPDGRLKVEFRLFDVLAQQQLTGLAYFTQPDGWRRIAHIIADAIYKRVTGEDGYFDTRVVYIAESGPATARQKRLAIMDQDGENTSI